MSSELSIVGSPYYAAYHTSKVTYAARDFFNTIPLKDNDLKLFPIRVDRITSLIAFSKNYRADFSPIEYSYVVISSTDYMHTCKAP